MHCEGNTTPEGNKFAVLQCIELDTPRQANILHLFVEFITDRTM